MKIQPKHSFIYFFLSLFISLSSYAATATETTTPATTATPATAPAAQKIAFPPTLKFNDQEWKLGYNHEDSDVALAEYVTRGENVNNWTELLTIQKFNFTIKKEVTPSAFADIEISQFKSQGYTVVTAITDANAQEAIFEFRVQAPKAEQQDEIQRIIKTADDKLIVLHYVVKKADMGDAERKKWIANLKSIDVSYLK